jgi:hypothetical protein
MKWFAVRQARTKTEVFERDFWSGGDLNSLFRVLSTTATTPAAWSVSLKPASASSPSCEPEEPRPKDVVDGSRRAMRATYQREVDEPRSAPRLSGFGRLGQPLHRPVRHRLGHHALLPRPRQRRPGHAFRRSLRALPKRWSPPPSACSPPFRRCRLQPLSRTTSTASRSATRASWKSFPTSAAPGALKPCASVA